MYLALLGWALAARDAHLLYRLAAHTADNKAHSKLFGGGVRRLLTTAPAQPQVNLLIIIFFGITSIVVYHKKKKTLNCDEKYVRAQAFENIFGHPLTRSKVSWEIEL